MDGRASKLPLLLILVLGQFMISVDYALASIALPAIGKGLHADPASVQWVLSGGALAWGGFLILGGRMCDVYGQKRCYLASLAIVTATTTLSALAPGLGWLIGARAIQGIGTALLYPAVLSFISIAFADGPERFRAFTVSLVAQIVASPLGSMCAAFVIGHFGWRAGFLMNVPLGLFGLVVGARILPRTEHTGASKEPIDLPGAVLVSIGLAALIWGASHVMTPATVKLAAAVLVGGLVLLGLFALRQRNPATALLPVALLKRQNLVAGVLVNACLGGGCTALSTLGVVAMQGAGFTAQQSSFILIPYGVLSVVFAMAGNGLHRFFLPLPKASLIAALLLTGGAFMLGAFASTPHDLMIRLVAAFAIAALTCSLGMALAMQQAVAHVPEKDQGVANALVFSGLQVAIAVTVSAMFSTAAAGAGAQTYVTGFWIGALVCGLGAVVALIGLRGRAVVAAPLAVES